MAQFVRVGEALVNVDRIRNIQPAGPKTVDGRPTKICVNYDDGSHDYITDADGCNDLLQLIAPQQPARKPEHGR